MNLVKTAALGAIGLMLAGGAALAQTGGSANNPNASGNVVPAPSSGPTDPAANDNPNARVPTGGASRSGGSGVDSGSGSGSSGVGGAASGAATGGTGTSSGGSGAGGTPRVQGETGMVPGSEAQTNPAR